MIFSRWGFLSFLSIGIGVAVALPVAAAVGLPNSGVHIGAMVFTVTALVNVALALWVYPRLDRPRPVTVLQPLPQPVPRQDGTAQTHQVVHAVDRDGNQIWRTPRSRLFFIPATLWWAVFSAIALALWIATFVQTQG